MQWHGSDMRLETTGSEKTHTSGVKPWRATLPTIKSAVSTDCHLATVPMLLYDQRMYRIALLRDACAIR